MFGLPCSTTCDNYMLKEKLQPGFNIRVIKQASLLYNGAPVIEASDEGLLGKILIRLTAAF